jgi:Coenzyme PQQ synthesis protein D (PqqD)
MQYRVNIPVVAYEVFDDETVLLNLERGAYYSLNSSASEIWRLILDGESAEAMPAIIALRFEIAPPIEEVTRVLETLLEQQLIVIDEASAAGDRPPPPLLHESWCPPVIAIYDDMKELLALDPPVPSIVRGTS